MTRTVIRGGQVFDSMGGTASIADVAVEGDRIVDVGTSLDGDDAMDATGHAVFPGFIDSHVHFMVDGDLDPMTSVHTPFSMNFYLAAERMARTLAGSQIVRFVAHGFPFPFCWLRPLKVPPGTNSGAVGAG